MKFPQKIPASQVRAAIQWVEYTTQQALSINIEVCDSDALESNLAKIISFAERKGGTVSVRDVSKTFNGKHRKSNQEIQEWFAELVAMNYGEVTSKGRSILFSLAYVSPMSPLTYNPTTVRVIDGDIDVPIESPIPPMSPLSDVLSPINQSNGDKWGHIGDTGVPIRKSLPAMDLMPNGDIGDTFTPSPEISQSSTLSCTTENKKSSAKERTVKKPTPRIFELGDRVVVKGVGGRYQGVRGVIIEIRSHSTHTGLMVKFDKEVAFSQQCEFIAGDLMYLAPGQ